MSRQLSSYAYGILPVVEYEGSAAGMPSYDRKTKREAQPLLSQCDYDEETELTEKLVETPKKEKASSLWSAFPKCIFFILGNEFCERYSYYGMRTILVLYLRYYLKWDEDTSTAVYHAFTVLCYLFPLFGAIVADSWWGKYNTILWLSIVYSIGMVLNTLGAIGTLGDIVVHAILSSAGLLVIAVGTGGIKPCVAAFGGDQFEADQESYRRRFFSLFYFAINAGSLVSTFVSPIIRDSVQCFGDDCYALAFGIPAALMVVAIILFLAGTKFYKRNEPTNKIFFIASSCIGLAIKNRWNTPSKQRNKDHWMDYAIGEDGKNARLVRDIKYVFRILILYIPLPLFWTLFDQQGSRWTLQAVRMNGYVGALRILPDQMQICNPLFIVCLIPIFEATLYPCLRKYNINFSPLRRMTLGMILAGISFVIAAVIQMQIDINLTRIPSSSQTSLRVINAANCDLRLNLESVYPNLEMDGSGEVILPINGATNTKEDMTQPGTYNIGFACGMEDMQYKEAVLGAGHPYDFVVSKSGTLGGEYKTLLVKHATEKSDSGKCKVGVINTLDTEIKANGQPVGSNLKMNITFEEERGAFTVEIVVHDGEAAVEVKKDFTNDIGTGGLYTLVVSDLGTSPIVLETDLDAEQYTDIYENDVSIFWMIPQYFIITLGEVFLSVTGLEFSYSQAPPSMKSILQAAWLLTVSIGNIIVLIIAEAKLVPNQADEYFLFAGLIGVAAILFVILSIRYKYVDESEFDDDYDDDETTRSIAEHQFDASSLKKGKANEAFEHDTGF